MTILGKTTTVVMTKDISRNRILESRDCFLSYIQIGLHTSDEKYRIHSNKTETATDITIHKMSERLESNNILEGIDDEG